MVRYNEEIERFITNLDKVEEIFKEIHGTEEFYTNWETDVKFKKLLCEGLASFMLDSIEIFYHTLYNNTEKLIWNKP